MACVFNGNGITGITSLDELEAAQCLFRDHQNARVWTGRIINAALEALARPTREG